MTNLDSCLKIILLGVHCPLTARNMAEELQRRVTVITEKNMWTEGTYDGGL